MTLPGKRVTSGESTQPLASCPCAPHTCTANSVATHKNRHRMAFIVPPFRSKAPNHNAGLPTGKGHFFFRPICLNRNFQRKRPMIKEIGRYQGVYGSNLCTRREPRDSAQVKVAPASSFRLNASFTAVVTPAVALLAVPVKLRREPRLNEDSRSRSVCRFVRSVRNTRDSYKAAKTDRNDKR